MAVGHIYYFLEDIFPHQPGGRKILVTPQFLKNLCDPAPEVPGSHYLFLPSFVNLEVNLLWKCGGLVVSVPSSRPPVPGSILGPRPPHCKKVITNETFPEELIPLKIPLNVPSFV